MVHAPIFYASRNMLPVLRSCWARGFLAVVGLLGGGCAQVLGIEDTSLASEGGGGSGGSGGAGLSLPPLCSEAQKPDNEETLDVTMTTVTFTTQQPVKGMSVRAFRSPTDFATFSSTVACGLSNDEGNVTVSLPKGGTGFGGFLSVRGEGQESFFYFFSPPLQVDESFGFLCVSNSDWTGLRNALGVEDLSATHGQVTVNALSSDGAPLENVSFEISGADENSKAFYFTDSGQPSFDQGKTSKPGFGGFFNVPAKGGVKTVRMKDEQGTTVGSVEIYVYPGTWSTMRLKPSN